MKILIVRFSSIGDIVLTSPIVSAIRSQKPDWEIHYLTKRKFVDLVQFDPNIYKVWTIEKDIDELKDELSSEKFEVLIDLHNNLRTHRLSKMLRVKTYRFPKLNVKKWLLVNFKRNVLPHVHVVDRYFEAVKPIGITNNQHRLFFYSDGGSRELPTLPDRYIAIAIGAQFATKRMPDNLLQQVIEKVQTPVVLLGGAEDMERVQAIGELDNVINLCGQLSLSGSAEVVKRSQCLLTNDTGMMHIASAESTPIVSVWGNTVPEFGMYPYRPNEPKSYVIHEVKDLKCRPCSKIGYQKCPKGHFDCMNKQDVSAIVDSINHFLQKTTSSAQ